MNLIRAKEDLVSCATRRSRMIALYECEADLRNHATVHIGMSKCSNKFRDVEFIMYTFFSICIYTLNQYDCVAYKQSSCQHVVLIQHVNIERIYSRDALSMYLCSTCRIKTSYKIHSFDFRVEAVGTI